MMFKDLPIQRKLIIVNLLISGAVLVLTSITFFAYEYHTFRQTTISNVSSIGKIIAANSTAALAFGDEQAANEILAALRAEKHIKEAVLLDTAGSVLAYYPPDGPRNVPRENHQGESYEFFASHLEGYQPVIQGTNRLGTLHLKSDLKAMEERFQLYSLITISVVAVAILLAYLLSNIFQKTISTPLLALAETARAISERQDYSVRMPENRKDELGTLNAAFNHMLTQIQDKTNALNEFNKNLEQKINERTKELELAIEEQKEAEREIHDKNQELAQALEELQSAEEHLLKLNMDLEKRVEERTKELITSEKKLKLKNKELEKTNIDLDNFIYTASHDLKSPIVNLEGLLNVIYKKFESKISTDDMKILGMVDTSIQKLKATIKDLAEITKVQKELEEHAEEVSFVEIIDDVKEGIKRNIEEANAVVHADIAVDTIEYPRKNIRSILYNLLSNSIKYRSKRRPLQINIKTYTENGCVVLAVQDNGLGIRKDLQHKLFTMFKRLHTHVEGTGIGLYIIKRVIENRGGRIEVESDVEKGSTFKVFFTQSA